MAPVRPTQPITKGDHPDDSLTRLKSKDAGLKKGRETDKCVIVKKRTAFVDLTNAIEKSIVEGKKGLKSLTGGKRTKGTKASQGNRTGQKKGNKSLQKLRQEKRPVVSDNGEELLDVICESLPSSQSYTSSQGNKADDISAYETAPEASSPDLVLQRNERNNFLSNLAEDQDEEEALRLPPGVVDFDKETSDVFAVSTYAFDIFNYFKTREAKFRVPRYMESQMELTVSMRAILIDWMVEVQESFELNHETLYLGVKLVDLFLAQVPVTKEGLQLIGATAIFIAAKFDERFPPPLDDFLYICDEAYMRREMIQTEMKMLRTVGFDLGIPLSYRYLRRYARSSKQSMEVVTLARYILETSLMEYDLTSASWLPPLSALLSR